MCSFRDVLILIYELNERLKPFVNGLFVLFVKVYFYELSFFLVILIEFIGFVNGTKYLVKF